tara:strand:- start:939 stop:1994 length:1056 start_codon:yes stop_codon:yes gene_type:complete
MKMEHYPIAGLDFIFDKNGKPWFLEANSASTVHEEFEKVYGDPTTVKKIAKYINSLPGKNFCMFVKKKYWESGNKAHYLAEKLTEFVKKDIHVCYMDKNLRVSRPFFLDHNYIKLTLTNFHKGGGNSYVLDKSRKKVKPDIIFRNYFQLNPEFEQEGVNVINTMAVRDLCWFKNKTYDAVEDVKGINIPKYFLVNSNEELKHILKTHKSLFKKGYVVKPLGNSLGRSVKVMDTPRVPPNFKVGSGFMVQQRITPNLVDKNKYWDLRVFVINGKYAGAVKRVSPNKVTNIYQGGYGAAVETALQDKIKKVSERITKAMEIKAKEMAKENYNYILTPEKPKLQKVMWHPMGEE